MLLSIGAWLLGSKVGRWLLSGLLLTAFVLIVLARVYSAGGARERLKQKEATMRNLQDRVKKDAEISSLPRSERARRLERWVRD
jgi:hypothetical protein